MNREIKTPGELNLRLNPADELYTSEWMAAIERQYNEKRWAYVPLDTIDPVQISRILSCFMHKGWHPVEIYRQDNLVGFFFFDALANSIIINHDIPLVRQLNLIEKLTVALESTFSCYPQWRTTVFLRKEKLHDLKSRLIDIWESRRDRPRIIHQLPNQEQVQ